MCTACTTAVKQPSPKISQVGRYEEEKVRQAGINIGPLALSQCCSQCLAKIGHDIFILSL